MGLRREDIGVVVCVCGGEGTGERHAGAGSGGRSVKGVRRGAIARAWCWNSGGGPRWERKDCSGISENLLLCCTFFLSMYSGGIMQL